MPDENLDAIAFIQKVTVEASLQPNFPFAIGGTAPGEQRVEVEYGIEAGFGGHAHVSTCLAGAIESLPDFRNEARLITRTVTYGPWRYVTAEEVRNA